jgi:hypothetical protein
MRERVHAVDAAIGPEIHQHHFAAQIGQFERRGIEPVAEADEIGRGGLRRGDIERCFRRACRITAEGRHCGARDRKHGDGGGCGERA